MLRVLDPRLFLQVIAAVSRADPASARAFLAANGVGPTHRRTERRGGGSGGLSLSSYPPFVEISLLSGEPPTPA